jgi:hypothetical protein
VYPLADGSGAVILGRVLEGRDVKAAFSLQVLGTSLTGLERFLNIFEAALAITLSHSAPHGFSGKPHQFGDELIELAISKSFSKGYYDHRSFQQLIEIFHNLATTRFEGRNFTTGLVLSRSFYAFAQKHNHSREGTLFPLTTSRKLSPADPIEKRFWYLADGQTSYFLANPSLEVGNVFMADASRQALRSFVDDYTLSKTVMGGDALFRVTSQAEFSITGSSGIEFNFKEGRWRVRNLLELARLIQATLDVGEAFVQSFLFYVFYLSRRRLSSILWVPTDLSQVDALLLSKKSTDYNAVLADERQKYTDPYPAAIQRRCFDLYDRRHTTVLRIGRRHIQDSNQRHEGDRRVGRGHSRKERCGGESLSGRHNQGIPEGKSFAHNHLEMPNPSLKRSANGRPPGPVWRYTVHFRQPGPGVLPSSPA